MTQSASWTLSLSATDAPVVDDSSQEARLIAAGRRGDEDAFAALVTLHQRRVFKLAGRFFRQRADVEDVAQETFLTAWRKLDSFRAESPFESWLTRICLNVCYGRLRRHRPEDSGWESLPEPESVSHDPNAAMEVSNLLRTLHPKDRFILRLLDGEGWSIAQIAERLGWTRVNVKVRAHRARKRLRKLLEQGAHS